MANGSVRLHLKDANQLWCKLEKQSGTTSSLQASLNCLIPTNPLNIPEPSGPFHSGNLLSVRFSSFEIHLSVYPVLRKHLFKTLLLVSLFLIFHEKGKKLSKIYLKNCFLSFFSSICLLEFFFFHPPTFSSIFKFTNIVQHERNSYKFNSFQNTHFKDLQIHPVIR